MFFEYSGLLYSVFCVTLVTECKIAMGIDMRIFQCRISSLGMCIFCSNQMKRNTGIRKIHGHTDTRTLYTDLLFWINFWKLEKYTDPLEKYTDPLTHGFNTQNLENQLVQNWNFCSFAHFVSLKFIKSQRLAFKFGQKFEFSQVKIPWNQFLY